MTKIALPDRRASENVTLSHGGQQFTLTIGYHEDRPIEVFVFATKAGSQVETLGRDGAILLSHLMRHGADIADIAKALSADEDGEPSTIIGAIANVLKMEMTP